MSQHTTPRAPDAVIPAVLQLRAQVEGIELRVDALAADVARALALGAALHAAVGELVEHLAAAGLHTIDGLAELQRAVEVLAARQDTGDGL